MMIKLVNLLARRQKPSTSTANQSPVKGLDGATLYAIKYEDDVDKKDEDKLSKWFKQCLMISQEQFITHNGKQSKAIAVMLETLHSPEEYAQAIKEFDVKVE